MSSPAVEALLALQLPDGSFPSVVLSGQMRSTDYNGFATATVLRLLRHLPGSAALEVLRERGLAFLACCRSALVPGAFAFWPDGGRPDWARSIPADVDDTAMMLSLLVRAGRVTRAGAVRNVCRVLLTARVYASEGTPRPPWIAPGSFHTWLDTGAALDLGRSPNVVDCCVNANVVALLAQLEATHLPGHDEAIRTITSGVEWAGRDAARLESLSPFYPSIRALAEALEHAIDCGAGALRPALARLRTAFASAPPNDDAICRSAYGGTTWHCEAVVLARAIAAEHEVRAARGAMLVAHSAG